MSFILEALSKAEAEQDRGTAIQYTQALPPLVKNDLVSRWLLIVLILIGGGILMLGAYMAAQHFNTSRNSLNPEISKPTITNAAPENQIELPGKIRQKPESIPKTERVVSNSLHDALLTRGEKIPTSTTSHKKDSAYQTPSLHKMVSQEMKVSRKTKTPESNNLGITTEPATDATYVKYEIAPKIEAKKNNIQALPLSMHALSELEISVHMYSETPSKRFIYIKSIRYGEGAKIGEGLVLEEITGTGVVLNYQGASYQLPVKM